MQLLYMQDGCQGHCGAVAERHGHLDEAEGSCGLAGQRYVLCYSTAHTTHCQPLFQGSGGGPFGKPPASTSMQDINVKLLTAMQPNMIPKATALLTLKVRCRVSRNLLNSGATASAAVSLRGRSMLPIATYNPAYMPRKRGHMPGSNGVRPVCFTTVSQDMVTSTPAFRLLITPYAAKAPAGRGQTVTTAI